MPILRAFAVTVAILLVGRSGANAAPAHGTADHGGLLAHYAATACKGTCPVYAIDVYRDGFVKYEGKAFVKRRGVATARLPSAKVGMIRYAFESAAFRSLPVHCCDCRPRTDFPSVILAIEDARPRVEVVHYAGCAETPSAVHALEERLKGLLRVERWIGKEAEPRRHPLDGHKPEPFTLDGK
jgi:hypothetical protein